MNKSKAQNLDDFFIEQILSMSQQEIDDEFENEGSNCQKEIVKFNKALEKASLTYRKQKLLALRTDLDTKNIKTSESKEILNHLKKSGIDIRSKLANLVASGDAPVGITMAFREGKEITDEEAESILEDLIELGIVKDDKQKDSE